MENRSSGLSGGCRVPRKVRITPHCQAASVCTSQGDLIAEQLLWNQHSQEGSRGLCGARGRGAAGVPGAFAQSPARGCLALGYPPDAAQGGAERGAPPCAWPGVPSPQSWSRCTHCHASTLREHGRDTCMHTHVHAHTRGHVHGRMHTHGDMHVDVSTHIYAHTGTCMWTVHTHTWGHARGCVHTHAHTRGL